MKMDHQKQITTNICDNDGNRTQNIKSNKLDL